MNTEARGSRKQDIHLYFSLTRWCNAIGGRGKAVTIVESCTIKGYNQEGSRNQTNTLALEVVLHVGQ